MLHVQIASRTARAGAVLTAAALFALTACGDDEPVAGDGGTTTVRMALSGGSLGFYAYFAAEELGYFEEEGLDVEIVTTGGSSESAQLAAVGRADVADGGVEAMMQAMTKADLYPFYNVWTKDFRTWSVPADSDIQDLADLEGTVVGVASLSGGETPLVRGLLAQEGLLDQVQLVEVSEEPPVVLTALEESRVQSYAGNIATPVAIQENGFELRSILPDDFANGPAAPIFATAEFSEQTDVLAGIGRAIAKGQLFCLTNVAACVEAIGQGHPELTEDPDLAESTLTGYFAISTPEEVDGKYFFGGVNDPEDYQPYLDLASTGPEPLIENPDDVDLEGLVINLDEEINDFDYDAVVAEAEGYSSGS